MLEKLKILLTEIKDKIKNCETMDFRNQYLENYLDEFELSQCVELVNNLTIKDLGCSKSFQNLRNYIQHGMNYISIFDDPFYSVGIFYMPKGTIIPLHDHENMMGMSKVISGSIRIESYDRVSYKNDQENYFEVMLVEDSVFSSNEVSIFTPYSKNYHQITALKDTAFLNILVPDYGDNDCNYFKLSKTFDKLFFGLLPSNL
jgi:hypothetical protein